MFLLCSTLLASERWALKRSCGGYNDLSLSLLKRGFSTARRPHPPPTSFPFEKGAIKVASKDPFSLVLISPEPLIRVRWPQLLE